MIRSWRQSLDEFTPFLAFPAEPRHLHKKSDRPVDTGFELVATAGKTNDEGPVVELEVRVQLD